MAGYNACVASRSIRILFPSTTLAAEVAEEGEGGLRKEWVLTGDKLETAALKSPCRASRSFSRFSNRDARTHALFLL